jgi:hypothetical protein
MIKYNSMYNKENKIYEEVDKKLLSKWKDIKGNIWW